MTFSSPSPEHELPQAPSLELPRHSRALRTALLKGRTKMPHRLLGRWFFSSPMKRVMAPAAIVGLAFVAAVFSFVPRELFQAPMVHAQELVNRAVARVAVLPTETREEIEKRIKADMDATLAEARAAKDLRIMTADEFEQEMQAQQKATMPNMPEWTEAKPAMGVAFTTAPAMATDIHVIQGVAGATVTKFNDDMLKVEPDTMFSVSISGTSTLPVMGEMVSGTPAFQVAPINLAPVNLKQPTTYLSYTDSHGQKVTLGLDEDDVPVMKMIRLEWNVAPGDMSMGTINVSGTTQDVRVWSFQRMPAK